VSESSGQEARHQNTPRLGFDEAATAFLDYLEFHRGYSLHTVKACARDLRRFRQFLATGYLAVDSPNQMPREMVVQFALGLNGDAPLTVRRKLAAIALDDLDLDAEQLMVRGKGSKQRVVPLMSAVVDEAREHLTYRARAESRHLFVGRLGGRPIHGGASAKCSGRSSRRQVSIRTGTPEVLLSSPPDLSHQR
jgi:site-specific recombinase XerC